MRVYIRVNPSRALQSMSFATSVGSRTVKAATRSICYMLYAQNPAPKRKRTEICPRCEIKCPKDVFSVMRRASRMVVA